MGGSVAALLPPPILQAAPDILKEYVAQVKNLGWLSALVMLLSLL